MNVQPLQPWARAWDRRMRERKEVEPPTELEQTLADYADFLSCAPMRMVEGFEVEIGEFGGCRTVARLSCGHTQGRLARGRHPLPRLLPQHRRRS
jgi:hypothetical protein